MIARHRGIFERGGDVGVFEDREVREDLLAACSRGEEAENVCNADAKSANARTTAALVRVEGDAGDLAHGCLIDRFEAGPKPAGRRSEIREISSLLHQTLAHLIKVAVDPQAPAVDHCFDEILTLQGDAVIAMSPGLKQRLDLTTIWRVACNGATRALARRGVLFPTLPKSCPLTLDQLLYPEFDPDSAASAIKLSIETRPDADSEKS